MISIDGLPPAYVTSADHYGLKIPTLRRILSEGSHAESVRSVLPTVTYPAHTTLLTGVWPSKHGIVQNVALDPLDKNLAGWYWYSEDIRVPTLWEVAARAGYAVGSVSWPVSVGERRVHYLIPEYWRAFTPDDLKVIRALSTPGLLDELQPQLGPYIFDLDNAIPGDWSRTRYAEAIIRKKHARFVTVHLGALDHLEHEAGPYSPPAFSTLEEIDKMVAVLEKAIRDEDPQAVVCIVSDHGFAGTDHQLNLRVAFVQAGLLTPNTKKTTARAAGFTDWKAEPWSASGSALIVLKDPADKATRDAVEKLLRDLAADPANGIEQVLDRKAIAALGGAPNAEFIVDMKSNFTLGSAIDGPLAREIKPGGTHGYSPTHPEMRSAFFMAGPGIRRGSNVGDIDMRSIAPTVAKLLGVALPAADLPALDVFTSPAGR
jgi:predicted AlkP superfamily pyrophosphatase or phosphodiesterase